VLKFLFWTLILGNVLLFAYQQGYMETVASGGHEPGRAARQINADKFKLVPAPAPAPAVAPAPATPPADAAKAAEPQRAAAANEAPSLIACTEIGNFDAADAKRFKARVAALALGERLSQHAVAEDMRHIVFIPSQGSKEGADRKTMELRQLGIKDFYVIQDDNALHWGISLGIFRSDEAARAHLGTLTQKGVRSARVGPYSAPTARLAFRMRGIDAKARAELDKIGKDFPQQQMRSCASA
jgi:hypothetical protein